MKLSLCVLHITSEQVGLGKMENSVNSSLLPIEHKSATPYSLQEIQLIRVVRVIISSDSYTNTSSYLSAVSRHSSQTRRQFLLDITPLENE